MAYQQINDLQTKSNSATSNILQLQTNINTFVIIQYNIH